MNKLRGISKIRTREKVERYFLNMLTASNAMHKLFNRGNSMSV